MLHYSPLCFFYFVFLFISTKDELDKNVSSQKAYTHTQSPA